MLRNLVRLAPKKGGRKTFIKASSTPKSAAAALAAAAATAPLAAGAPAPGAPKVTMATKKAMAGKLRFDSSKAGLQSVDKAHVEKVIQEASKNSPFALKEQQREEARQKRALFIQKKAEQFSRLPEDQKDDIRAKVDAMEEEMEKTRDMGRKCIHVDMDMFFAAVAEKRNPALHDVPFGVGSKTMLSTTNYLARQYGVRSGMPGFIGKKLCPDLVIVPVDFPSYQKEAAAIQSIAARYDPNFVSLGLDELTMDVTEYLRENPGLTAKDVCSSYRLEVFAATQLTCSGGIAPSGALAKIACNVNKPNGQYELKLTTRREVLEYMKTVPLRMVPGIGYAQELVLNAIDVKTCGDLLDNKYLLAFCFKEKTFRHYLACGLGLMAAHGHKQHEGPQSIGKECSFPELESADAFWKLFRSLLVPCHAQIIRQHLCTGRMGLVLKTRSFDAEQFSVTLPEPTSDLMKLLEAGRMLMAPHLENYNDYRLLGVRLQKLTPDTRRLGSAATPVTRTVAPPPAATEAAHARGSTVEDDEDDVEDEDRDDEPRRVAPSGERHHRAGHYASPAPKQRSAHAAPKPSRPAHHQQQQQQQQAKVAPAKTFAPDDYSAYDDIELDEEEERRALPTTAKISTAAAGGGRRPAATAAADDDDDDLAEFADLEEEEEEEPPKPVAVKKAPLKKKPVPVKKHAHRRY